MANTVAQRHAWKAKPSNLVQGRKVVVAGGRMYFEIWYKGRHVGELFKGKARWYAVIFGRSTVRSLSPNILTQTIKPMIMSPRN